MTSQSMLVYKYNIMFSPNQPIFKPTFIITVQGIKYYFKKSIATEVSMYLAVFIFSTVPHHIRSGELSVFSHSGMCQTHQNLYSYTNICCIFLFQLKFISCLWRITIVWNCVRHFCTLFPGIFSFICGPNGEPKSECCASFFYAMCSVSQYRDLRD